MVYDSWFTPHGLPGTLFMNQPFSAGFNHQQCFVAGGFEMVGTVGLAEFYSGMAAITELNGLIADIDLDGFWRADALFAGFIPRGAGFTARGNEIIGIERQ